MGSYNETWYGKVCQLDIPNHTLKVQWYQETRRQDAWTLTNHEDTIHFVSLLPRVQTRRVFAGFRFEDLQEAVTVTICWRHLVTEGRLLFKAARC